MSETVCRIEPPTTDGRADRTRKWRLSFNYIPAGT